jgi:hypothetical protein
MYFLLTTTVSLWNSLRLTFKKRMRFSRIKINRSVYVFKICFVNIHHNCWRILVLFHSFLISINFLLQSSASLSVSSDSLSSNHDLVREYRVERCLRYTVDSCIRSTRLWLIDVDPLYCFLLTEFSWSLDTWRHSYRRVELVVASLIWWERLSLGESVEN